MPYPANLLTYLLTLILFIMKNSTYKTQVLEVNSNFKKAIRTTGKGLSILLASEVLTPSQVKRVKDIKKNDELYKKFDATVRRTSKNEVTVFYILQALHKDMK
jgi:hypothetical protein